MWYSSGMKQIGELIIFDDDDREKIKPYPLPDSLPLADIPVLSAHLVKVAFEEQAASVDAATEQYGIPMEGRVLDIHAYQLYDFVEELDPVIFEPGPPGPDYFYHND
jgi:hypothetical protein